jgi:hypothetical protein
VKRWNHSAGEAGDWHCLESAEEAEDFIGRGLSEDEQLEDTQPEEVDNVDDFGEQSKSNP